MKRKTHLNEEELNLWQMAMRSVVPMHSKQTTPPLTRLPRVDQPNHYVEPFIDLHGQPIKNAHERTHEHLDRSRDIGWNKVTVVTGKSGPISAEFKEWLGGRQDVKKAHPRNGGGAWDIWFKRRS